MDNFLTTCFELNVSIFIDMNNQDLFMQIFYLVWATVYVLLLGLFLKTVTSSLCDFNSSVRCLNPEQPK